MYKFTKETKRAGMSKCPKCPIAVWPTQNYCEGCGYNLKKITEEDIKVILDNLHKDFNITEIEVDGVAYRWPMNIHDENCRSN